MRGLGLWGMQTLARGDPKQERLATAPCSLSRMSLCPLPNSLATLRAALGGRLSCWLPEASEGLLT